MRTFSFLGAFCLFSCLSLSACTSLNTAVSFNDLNLEPESRNVCHVNGKISGLYLFHFPIVSGDPAAPGELSLVFFRDTANLNTLADMMSRVLRQQGASDLVDVNSSSSNTWLFPTWVLFWRSHVMSGNAVIPATRVGNPPPGGSGNVRPGDGLKPPAPGEQGRGISSQTPEAEKAGVQSAVVELERKRSISGLTIQWGPTAAAEYEVLVSLDKTDWQQVASVSDGMSGEKRNLKFKTIEASYIKVLAKRPTGPGEYSIVQMLAS